MWEQKKQWNGRGHIETTSLDKNGKGACVNKNGNCRGAASLKQCRWTKMAMVHVRTNKAFGWERPHGTTSLEINGKGARVNKNGTCRGAASLKRCRWTRMATVHVRTKMAVRWERPDGNNIPGQKWQRRMREQKWQLQGSGFIEAM
jgi:hypothetical protein